MSQVIYSVRNWDAYYENSESRKIKHCRYVLTPNKHDGRGYGRMMAHPEGERLFAAWNAIIQVASKCQERGVLKDQDGPLTASDLSFKTRLKVETFELALKFFSDASMGWLSAEPVNSEQISLFPGRSGDHPETSGRHPGIPPIEGKGREQKGIEQQEVMSPPAAATTAPEVNGHKKPEKPKFPEGSIPLKLALYFEKFRVTWAPGCKPADAARLQLWAHHFDLMVRIDERTPRRISEMIVAIDHAKPDRSGFEWRRNILSAETLRQRWNEGKLAMFEEAMNGTR